MFQKYVVRSVKALGDFKGLLRISLPPHSPPPPGSETTFVTRVEEVLFSSQIETPAGALVHFVSSKKRKTLLFLSSGE